MLKPPLEAGVSTAATELQTLTHTNTEDWYGNWLTIGNAPGSIGFAGTPTSAPNTTTTSSVSFPLSNATIGVAETSVLSANGGSFTLGGTIVVYSGRSAASGMGNATGCWTLSTATGSVISGTALGYTSIGFGPLAVYQKFGDTGGTNEPIPGSTQGFFGIAAYYGPTVDDSAEGFSFAALLKDTGTPFTQNHPLTAGEFVAQVEGGNTLASGVYALGVGSRLNVTGTATVNQGYGFRASVNSSGGPPYGTLSNYTAFSQSAASGATTAYGVYTVDQIASETGLGLGKTAYSGSLSAKLTGNSDGSATMLLLTGPTNAEIAGGLTQVRLNAGSGQTKALQEWWDSGGTKRHHVSSAGTIVSFGSSYIGQTGAGTPTCRVDGTAGYLQAGTSAAIGGKIFSGSGAPGTISSQADGDIYIRTDGGAGTTIYQRRAGAWVATAA